MIALEFCWWGDGIKAFRARLDRLVEDRLREARDEALLKHMDPKAVDRAIRDIRPKLAAAVTDYMTTLTGAIVQIEQNAERIIRSANVTLVLESHE